MATLPADLVAVSRHRLTVANFRRMGEVGILGPDDRVELIAGEIIDMSPIGSLHAALVARLASTLGQRVGETAIIWTQNPLALDDTSQPQPDLTVLRPRADFHAAAHPGPADVLLVIEVADTTLAFDLDVKVPLYAAGDAEASTGKSATASQSPMHASTLLTDLVQWFRQLITASTAAMDRRFVRPPAPSAQPAASSARRPRTS
jgi:hypothetical protein